MSPDIYFIRVGTEDWVKAVNNDFWGFADRFIFGTAYPLVALKTYMDAWNSVAWRPDVLPKILYKNALRALKLEDDPTFKEMYRL